MELSKLPTFWIFPYFMETRIVEEMPSLKMCEFKVGHWMQLMTAE